MAHAAQNTSTDILSRSEYQKSGPKVPALALNSPKAAKTEDDFMEGLIRSTDRAIEALKSGNPQYAVHILKGVEEDLEQEAVEGKVLDRNLIIVCLYNLACAYQGTWCLDDCLKYIDAVVYNLNESLVQDQNQKSPKHAKVTPRENMDLLDTAAMAVKLQKQTMLLKVYLQQSAILSQLERHKESLARAWDAQNLMDSIIKECHSVCVALKVNNSCKSPRRDFNASQITFNTTSASGKSREVSFFRDEVSYIKGVVDFASPFLKDFTKTLELISTLSKAETLHQAKKTLNTWKNHFEGRQKSPRKALLNNGLLFSSEVRMENRSLLGVQHAPSWLETLNIDSIIQMQPLKYKEYAQKRDVAKYLSQELLQEKAIYQSLIFFMLSTESRLLEAKHPLTSRSYAKANNFQKFDRQPVDPELYHLRAIEVVCKYINGPCPYIDHLASRYFKHFGQDLKSKTIGTPLYQADQEALNQHDSNLGSRQSRSESPSQNITHEILNHLEEEIPVHKEDLDTGVHSTKKIDLDYKIIKTLPPEKSKKPSEPKTHRRDLALYLRRLEAVNMKSPVKKMAVKLSPRPNDIDLERPQTSTTEKRLKLLDDLNFHQEVGSTLATSHINGSLSPKNLLRDKKENEDGRAFPDNTYFWTREMSNVKFRRIPKDEKEKQFASSFALKGSPPSETGLNSERGAQTDGSFSGNESSDFPKWATRVQTIDPKAKNKSVVQRPVIYKKVSNTIDSKSKKETHRYSKTTHRGDKEESPRTRKVLASYSKKLVLNVKKENNLKDVVFYSPTKYVVPRKKSDHNKLKVQSLEINKIMDMKRTRNNVGVDSKVKDKSCEYGKSESMESVEEFNNNCV